MQHTIKLKWLALVLGTIIFLTIIVLIGKGCNGAEAPPLSHISEDSVAVLEPAVLVHESSMVKLPDGKELKAFKGGMEDQMVIFLNDPATVPGKDVWFDFDNLNFNTGSAQITDSSMSQIQNISAILKAYPKLKIKIGGYTDKTGDSLSNVKLSQSRSEAVVAALKHAGANMMQIVGAEGYGSQFAKADATASDEEKQKDRRISISVRAK